MEKLFNVWNELKKSLSRKEIGIPFHPKEGEVWMTVIEKNIGFEQDGGGNNFSRPVLVVKKFNNQMFWAVPLSTKQKDFDFYYNFTDPNQQPVSLILAQMRLLSIKRFIRDMYKLPDEKFILVKQKIKDFL